MGGQQEIMSESIYLVEQHIIWPDNPIWQAIDAASFAAKNIYNAANYRLRQAYVFQGRYLGYKTLEKGFKQADLRDDQQLPSKVVQQVLRQLDQDWQSFRAALAAWQVDPGKFTSRPQLPGYKHKTQGRAVLVYPENAYFQRDLRRGIIRLSGVGVTCQTKQNSIDQVRIVPRRTHYVIEIIYRRAVTPAQNINPDLYAAGDLGVDTLCALTSDKPGFVPLLVNGRVIKAINQGYNQRRAELQQRLPKSQYNSRQLDALTDNRNLRIRAELHRCSRLIVNKLVKEGIGTLIIGKNQGWKQEVNLGARTNQTFVSIPHAQFIEMLTYKAKLVGIHVIVTEESYTSKCSFLDLESIGKHEKYAGRRIKRGLFQSADGRLINADVNGSYNILRKVVPNAFANGIGAAVVQPVRVYPRSN
jgi:putative transposase